MTIIIIILADHRVKLKESKKRDKYQDLVREQKKLCNMKVMVITVVFGALGTLSKGLVQRLENLEIRGQVETIQNTPLFRLTRIPRKVLETCCHTESSKKSLAYAGMKKS